MKNIFIILILLLTTTILPSKCFAQDKIDRLADQISELAKQQSKLADKIDKLVEQQAVNGADIKALDKRFDILFAITITSSSILFAGIFGLIGIIFWDRKTAIRPIEDETKREIELLKERETKSENMLKKIFEKFPDLANS